MIKKSKLNYVSVFLHNLDEVGVRYSNNENASSKLVNEWMRFLMTKKI